jgi:hypothetical protein
MSGNRLSLARRNPQITDNTIRRTNQMFERRPGANVRGWRLAITGEVVNLELGYRATIVEVASTMNKST